MFYFGLTEKEGWFFTPTFHVYQRVNHDVYCYISRQLGFYTLQMYERGTTGYCLLEARSEANIEALFELGEDWLGKYEEWNEKALVKNPYFIGQQDWKEKCWIQ
ncbi:hypothetical protein CVD28_02090 [Bacillus sp. M6-12]|uniref:hypothetical protein n=1 Tax=Bacillus sp. M6-12 TaxID=2054166 RepID=UPI000C76D31B|nr:hypothetical protein [Bacillus sp. M6-12]PLS19222.1 hypothetical protein CVD28_02090 [Bacillus sp. M6-12]